MLLFKDRSRGDEVSELSRAAAKECMPEQRFRGLSFSDRLRLLAQKDRPVSAGQKEGHKDSGMSQVAGLSQVEAVEKMRLAADANSVPCRKPVCSRGIDKPAGDRGEESIGRAEIGKWSLKRK